MLDWNELENRLDILKYLPEALRNKAALKDFRAKEILHHRGERPRYMLCVLSGELQLLRHDADGNVLIMQRMNQGFIAEASMLAAHYHCDLVAACDGRVLRFPITAFRRALDEATDFRQAWLGGLAREVRMLRAQTERLRLNGAAARILHFLETEGDNGCVILQQSRKTWAVELGLSHEVLYRTLRRLREEGTIRIEGNTLSLVRAGR